MDDPVVRLVIVLGAGLIVLGVWWYRKNRTPGRRISDTGLEPGLYLFSSETCLDCATARERLGSTPYVDITWETRPAEFERLGIWDVPSVLVVSVSGSGTWHRGVPSRVVKHRNP